MTPHLSRFIPRLSGLALAGATLIAGRAVDGAEADGLWAVLSPEMFELLTGSAGWSTQQYRRWLAGAMESLLGTPRHATERQTDES